MIVDHCNLMDLWNTPIAPETAEKHSGVMHDVFDGSALDAEKQTKVAELSAKFGALAENNSLNAIALRCWSEFAAGYGIASCGVMSIVQSDDLLLSCEGDLDCAITRIAHRAVNADTPFMADLSQVNIGENSALMWHCGVAPCNLADGVCDCTLDTYHTGGKGVTAEFVMKSVPINRSHLDSVNGRYRMFNRRGEAVSMEKKKLYNVKKGVWHNLIATLGTTLLYRGKHRHDGEKFGLLSRDGGYAAESLKDSNRSYRPARYSEPNRKNVF